MNYAYTPEYTSIFKKDSVIRSSTEKSSIGDLSRDGRVRFKQKILNKGEDYMNIFSVTIQSILIYPMLPFSPLSVIVSNKDIFPLFLPHKGNCKLERSG